MAVAAHISIEGLNPYDRVTLTDAFTDAGLDAQLTFNQQSRDPERAGYLDSLEAVVLLSQQATLVLSAWIMKTRRESTRIRMPDGTVIDHRRESFTSAAETKELKGLQAELGYDTPAEP
jgi:hypothetical protein